MPSSLSWSAAPCTVVSSPGLDIAEIQMREDRWVIADLQGKGGRVRTVAVPLWVKHGIDAWMTAAGIRGPAAAAHLQG